MFHYYCKQFLDYCQLSEFSERSIQALTIQLNEFKGFLKSQRIRSVKKYRVWMFRHFYHFLALHRRVPQNIAFKLETPI